MELITANTFVTYKITITLWKYFLVGKYEKPFHEYCIYQ